MKAHSDVPSPWVVRFASLLSHGGTVLDLACGGGRHTRYLVAKGHPVLAVDRDARALASLAIPGVELVCSDLERGPWPFPGRTFAGVVVAKYLYRPLFPWIANALADGGVLLYETFMRGHERFGRPTNPDFLLRPGELLEAFRMLGIIAFEQGCVESPEPAVLQRLCAVQGAVEAIALPLST